MNRSIAVVLVLFSFGAFFVAQAGEVSLKTLLEEIQNRDVLARFPNPAFSCRQSSSYDRDTVEVDGKGWFANWDRSQFVRIEETGGKKEYVMHDQDGPGSIVRIWGTWHGPGGGPFSNGIIRFYLDGEKTPAIEGKIADMISGGKLTGYPLSESVSPKTNYARRGHNLFLPIPYAEHCKITYSTDVPVDRGAKKGEALYYQINYRTYEKGTKVRSFSMDQLKGLKETVKAVGERLIRSGIDASGKTVSLSGALKPGECASKQLKGPAAIHRLTVKLEADDLPQALRSTVLKITFDGQRCVWVPVGDFFGTGYHIRPYKSWYTEVTEDGTLKAFWVMPFADAAEMAICNFGEQVVKIAAAEVQAGSWEWDTRSMHFHSAWREYRKIQTGPNKNMTGQGAFDVNYITVKGKGRYVGDTLVLFNGTASWWGEGDEKIFVDGEKFPSHIGTGTEDYYGYAWCRPEYFQGPFHAQPSGAGNLTVGFTVNSRYRGLDSIPFTSQITMDMEMWHWRSTKMNYAPTTFWYVRPGGHGNVKPAPSKVALPVARKQEDVVEIMRVKGAIEGEGLKVMRCSGGKTEVQSVADFNWSGGRQLWWKEGEPGDTLLLAVPCKKAGRYHIEAELTQAVDYGIVQMEINGVKAGSPIDLYAPQVEHKRFELGAFDLKKGTNQLKVTITGTSDKGMKKHMFGFDYLLIKEK